MKKNRVFRKEKVTAALFLFFSVGENAESKSPCLLYTDQITGLAH